MRPDSTPRSLPRYHLRFQVVPGPHVAARTRLLANFCRRHAIEEVVLFVAGEEWNNGLLSKRDEDRWFTAVQTAKRILERAGVQVSLNTWMTVLHCDRGRRFPPDRRFHPMVSPLGEMSKACASFACPDWRRYAFRLFGRFAKLGFRVIWVEDDFRYHNHGPLTWGGGFEPEMLARFEKTSGRRVTRAALVRNVLKPGQPHPWRARWMQTWRECQLEVARGFAQAVQRNSPIRTKMGLMSSHPAVHSVEGRDWHTLFRTLGPDDFVAHRPHFGGYEESRGRDKAHSICMLDLQRTLRPSGSEVAPEVENFPYTAWTKSDALTWAEMALCLFFGSDALLLNLFPFTGNPVTAEPRVGEMLDRSRPALGWIANRFPASLVPRGVGAPWKEDAQAHVRTVHGRSMYELDATSFGPGTYLLPYGVPVTAERRQVNAVFGSLAWAFDDDEIRELLTGGLLLDGISAAILCERGFSREIGAAACEIVDQEQTAYSVERAVSKRCGIQPGLEFGIHLNPSLARLEPLAGAEEWTTILTPEARRFGAGLVAFRNALGGRVAILAAPNPAGLPRSDHRQAMVQRVVEFLAAGSFGSPTVTGGPHCLPMHFHGHNAERLVVFNGAPDPVRPVVRWPKAMPRPRTATLLDPLQRPRRVRPTQVGECKEGPCYAPSVDMPYLAFLVIES